MADFEAIMGRSKGTNSFRYYSVFTFYTLPSNVGHMLGMHARPHRRKDQLALRSLRDLRSR